jgi:EAL and modified HD-GYP domain-containing signal transduction protein
LKVIINPMNVLCKQAIYDRNGKVAFYEVFIQDSLTNRHPEGLDPLKATTMAIDTITELNPLRVGGGKLVFINVPAIFLEASMFDLLPPEYVGIELVENRRLSNELFASINALLKKGFKFCIDDFGFEKIDYLPLLGKCHFVKINLKKSPYDMEELKEVISILKSLKKGLIAKNIETKEDYQLAYQLGFNFFQGFFLSRPIRVRDTRTISYLKTTILRLYKAIKNKDMKSIVDILEKDIGATYKFLKFLNLAYPTKIKDISKIDKAVRDLGLENIAKFTIVLALSEMFVEEDEVNLWKRSLFRASLAERLAGIYAPHIKEKAYLAGLFSLAGEILGQKPEDVVKELMLDRDIAEAFERRLNEIGFILSLVELLEDSKNERIINRVSKIINVDAQTIVQSIKDAERESELLSIT